jgi:hypothetical protein
LASIMTEVVLTMILRTKQSVLFAHRPSLPLMLFSLGALAIMGLAVWTPLGQQFFYFQPPTIHQFAILIGIVAGCAVTTEVVKLIYYRIRSAYTHK